MDEWRVDDGRLLIKARRISELESEVAALRLQLKEVTRERDLALRSGVLGGGGGDHPAAHQRGIRR